MTIMDKYLELSDAQSLAQGAGSTDSTNLIDFGDETQKPGIGTPLYLNVKVNTALVGAGATLKVQVADSSDNVFYEVPAIAVGTLVAGYGILRMPIDYNILQSLKLTYTTTSTFTAGKVDAWIDLAAQS